MPAESSLKRVLVLKASPSPANIRVGSSFSRLNANVPAVYGNDPGTLSSSSHLRISPSHSHAGSETFGTLLPDRVVCWSGVRISRSRTAWTYSSWA